MIKGTVIHEQKQFKKRGEYEKEMLRMAKHIIGRTSWDRARVWAINPDAQYYFATKSYDLNSTMVLHGIMHIAINIQSFKPSSLSYKGITSGYKSHAFYPLALSGYNNPYCGAEYNLL